jgi:hypothetical protein
LRLADNNADSPIACLEIDEATGRIAFHVAQVRCSKRNQSFPKSLIGEAAENGPGIPSPQRWSLACGLVDKEFLK